MAGNCKLFFEHGRTVVNEGSREPARRQSRRADTDRYSDADRRSPRREVPGVRPQRADSHRQQPRTSGYDQLPRSNSMRGYDREPFSGRRERVVPVDDYPHGRHVRASPPDDYPHSRNVRVARPDDYPHSHNVRVARPDDYPHGRGYRVRYASPEDFPDTDLRDWSMDRLNQEFELVSPFYPRQLSAMFNPLSRGRVPSGYIISRDDMVRGITTAYAMDLGRRR